MKRKMYSFLVLCLACLCALCAFACGQKDKAQLVCSLTENGEKRVVISVTETDGNCTLLDCMEKLSETETAFTYTLSGGMITKVNGTENAADFSSCWMIYTSDKEMSNAAWGEVECNGTTCGSAVVGVESLTVTAGEIYVLDYVIF